MKKILIVVKLLLISSLMLVACQSVPGFGLMNETDTPGVNLDLDSIAATQTEQYEMDAALAATASEIFNGTNEDSALDNATQEIPVTGDDDGMTQTPDSEMMTDETATQEAAATSSSAQSDESAGTMASDAAQTDTEESPCGDSYIVRSGDNLREIAEQCEVTVNEILEENEFIEDPDLIYPGWVIDIPGTENGDILIPETGAAAVSSGFYVVKAGDTIPYIANRLDLSEEDILNANPQLDEESAIFTGQILLLPGSVDEPSAAVSPRVVEPGQLVTIVARGFEDNMEVIVAGGPLGEFERTMETVNVNSEGLMRARLQVPMEAERGLRWTFIVRSTEDEDVQARTNIIYVVDTTGPNDAIVYNVRLNDTLSGIAAKFGVELSEVIDANPQIDDPSILYVGQDILIPGPEDR